MIDFACKEFDLNDIIKCGLGLTKTEYEILNYFLENKGKELITTKIAEELKLNLTTIQKATKKLYEKGILIRHQKNLNNGGYVYAYEISPKSKIRHVLKNIIKNWSEKVEREIDDW
jgi:predicted transcriptional regulator